MASQTSFSINDWPVGESVGCGKEQEEDNSLIESKRRLETEGSVLL